MRGFQKAGAAMMAMGFVAVAGCSRQKIPFATVPVQPSPSPRVVAGTATVLESGNEVVIDFSACQPQGRRVFVAMGSTTFRIEGMREGKCALRIGGEVEDPNWDGSLPTVCEVPVSMGVARLPKGQTGVDYSAIQQYCRL